MPKKTKRGQPSVGEIDFEAIERYLRENAPPTKTKQIDWSAIEAEVEREVGGPTPARAKRHKRAMPSGYMDDYSPSSGIEKLKPLAPLATGAAAFGAAALVPAIGMLSGVTLLGTVVAAIAGQGEVAKHLGVATVGLTAGTYARVGAQVTELLT